AGPALALPRRATGGSTTSGTSGRWYRLPERSLYHPSWRVDGWFMWHGLPVGSGPSSTQRRIQIVVTGSAGSGADENGQVLGIGGAHPAAGPRGDCFTSSLFEPAPYCFRADLELVGHLLELQGGRWDPWWPGEQVAEEHADRLLLCDRQRQGAVSALGELARS